MRRACVDLARLQVHQSVHALAMANVQQVHDVVSVHMWSLKRLHAVRTSGSEMVDTPLKGIQFSKHLCTAATGKSPPTSAKMI
jgi:hypothetical protein